MVPILKFKHFLKAENSEDSLASSCVEFSIGLSCNLVWDWAQETGLLLELVTGRHLWLCNAGFRLTCRLPHCRFDDDICSTAQAPLAAEGWPSSKQRQANRSITLPLCRGFAHRGRSQTVEFYSTRERCRSVIKPKRRCRWELQLWNSKRWSRGIAAKARRGKWQASLKPRSLLKPALLCFRRMAFRRFFFFITLREHRIVV